MSNFYKQIAELHGKQTVQELKEISNIKTKLTTLKNRRIFLLTCRKKQLTPNFLKFQNNFITFNNRNLQLQNENNIQNFTNHTLNLLITDTIKYINIKQKQHQHFLNKVKNQLDPQAFEQFINLENTKHERKFLKIKETHRKKIRNLEQNKTKTFTDESNTTTHTSWIENLTTVHIPNEIANVLSMGPNFSNKPHNKNNQYVHDIIAETEITIEKLNNETKNNIRHKISNAILKHKHKHKVNIQNQAEKDLEKHITETKKFLKQHPEIYVLKADKTQKTVLMEASEYETKMNNIIQDETTYKKIEKDPTATLIKQNNNLIQTWLETDLINIYTAAKLKNRNTHPPKIYGLPKLHKINIPLRPITSFIQSPLYNLTKYIADIIQSSTSPPPSNVRNSWEIKNELQTLQKVPKDHGFISLDVVSMYTSIPLELAIDAIKQKWVEIKKNTIFSKPTFMEAVQLCLQNSYMAYNKKFYKQIKGLPMGAPLSAITANLVMEKIEKEAIEKCDFPVTFYKRYVDDILCIIPTNKYNQILENFNQINQNIQFTIEKEQNKTIHFLDITITTDNNNNIATSWYTKPTWSGRYLNYNSHTAKIHKKNVATNICHRALSLTNPKDRPTVIKKLNTTLKNNSYPKHLIKKTIKEQTNKIYNQNNKTNKINQPTDNKKQIKYTAIPYINGLSQQIKNILKPYDIVTTFKNYSTLASLYTNTKEKKKTEKETHTVYTVPCNNCTAEYIGQTKQYLQDRLKAHKNSCIGKNTEKTALKNHTQDTGHTFNFDNTKILRIEQNEKKRLIYEMIAIKQRKTSINNRQDIEGLSTIYDNII